MSRDVAYGRSINRNKQVNTDAPKNEIVIFSKEFCTILLVLCVFLSACILIANVMHKVGRLKESFVTYSLSFEKPPEATYKAAQNSAEKIEIP